VSDEWPLLVNRFVNRYSPRQPRRPDGKFGSGGAGAATGAASSKGDGGFGAPSGPIENVRATQANLRALDRELTAQGLSEEHPMRGVLGVASYSRGDHKAVARDKDGKIIGGASYEINRVQRQVELLEMRVMTSGQRQGTGKALIRNLAETAGNLPRGHLYSMAVFGAVESAKPFYARAGATGVSHSSIMRWTPETLARLRRGEDPMTPEGGGA
jgi:GNAT superfamily N-acetyltransferase